jgi:glycosyltransferase involved in cell wall biosynthesis
LPEILFGLNSIDRQIKVFNDQDPDTNEKLTVFLGVYNAQQFIVELKSSLKNQSWNSYIHLLVVDNASTDESWRLLQDLLPDISARVTLVRNSVNVGALGSLYRNADLVTSEWLTFIHQDDLYMPNFLSSCLREIDIHREQPASTISFDYLTLEGKGPAHHSPNPTWFAKGWPPHIAFLENLANHAVPWPCTVFRSKYLLDMPVPFHSSAFLDTEIALKQVSQGSHVYVSERVMRYRVHVESGSHSLPLGEAEFLRTTSILRIVSSSNFVQLVQGIPTTLQASWMREVLDAASSYVVNHDLRTLMQLSIAESIVAALEYSNVQCNLILRDLLQKIGAHGPSLLMSRLNGSEESEVSQELLTFMAQGMASDRSFSFVRNVMSRVAVKLPRCLLVLLFRLLPKQLIPRPWSSFKTKR